MKYRFLFGFVLICCMHESSGQGIEILNNCTCKTSDGGIYSLMPLRRTDGYPKFVISGKKYPNWRYAYNPCTPIDVGQDDPDADPHKLCRNVAICQYAEIEKPREYHEVGLQRGVRCEITKDGHIALVYKTNDSSIDNPHSRVRFICDESASFPDFQPVDEDNYIFNITSHCGCRNGCKPGPVPGPTTATIGPYTNSTPSSRPAQQKKSNEDSNWELVILLPSLAGFFVIAICFFCLWRRLSAIQEALFCGCCHCYDNRDLQRLDRDARATERSSLINNFADNRAVEHEDAVPKGKVNEPVQVEEGDEGDDYKFAGKGDNAVVV